MFSKYRCYSLHEEKEPELEQQPEPEQQTNTLEKPEEQQTNTLEQNFAEKDAFHCLKKRKSILIFSLTNTVYNECAIEVHRMLNEEVYNINKATERVIQRVQEYSKERLQEDLKPDTLDAKELHQVIETLLTTILKTGINTIKLKQIYTSMFFRLARCMARLK